VDATHFAPRVVFPYAPKLVCLRAGGNDLWAGKPVEQVFADFKAFAESIHAKLPAAKIIFLSLSPSPARWSQHEKEKALNQLVADYMVGQPHLQFIDTYDLPLGADGLPRAELFVADKLHFNAAGYQMLAERVRPYLPKE
jgi:lysophospholipase L1-like esterase